MKRYDDFEIECPECGTKFKVDCDKCGYSIANGFCKWNMEHHDDPCTSDKYRWKPKKIKMNEYDMFLAILDYRDKNELYDSLENLELEWQNINEQNIDKWKSKVKRIYNKLKEKGVI